MTLSCPHCGHELTTKGGLTSRQRECLTFIQRHLQIHRETPTFREIAAGIKSNPGNVHRIIDCLEERGYVARLPHRPRSIKIISLP